MNELLNNFHFLRPWLLLLAIVPIGLYAFYNYGKTAQSSWRKIIDPRLLDFLLVKGSANKRKNLAHLAIIGLICTVFICAGPSWEKQEIPVLQKQNPVVLMLNMSSDMKTDDIKPNRLERAKYKIKDFLEQLHSTQTSLGVYSAEPFIIAPFSDDAKILQNLLPKISFDIMPVNGDRLDRAINLASDRITTAGYEKGNIIIFTPDIGQKFNLALKEAETAKAKGININVIGISQENTDKLKLLAQNGGGRFCDLLKDDKAIDDFAKTINQSNAPSEKGKNLSLQWLDGGWYFLVIPLMFCLAFFRRGILVVVLLLGISEAQAGFFSNADQDGLKAFKEQNYAKAATDFKNSDWKASSFYRQGNYAEAFKHYALNNSAEGLYNQGNALAKGGKIAEAIAKYEEVLKLQPDHEDAKFNLEYLKQQQNQQQQQQNQSSSQNNNSDDSSQSNEQNQDNNNDNNQNNQNNSGEDDKQSDEQNQQQQNQQQSQNNSESGNDNSSEQKQSDNQQEESNSSGDENQQNDNDNQTQDSTMDEQTQNQPQQQGKDTPKAQAEAQEGDDEDYDEKVQAKLQRYRDIPEDPGGLLRAFIAREYQKNRYNEE